MQVILPDRSRRLLPPDPTLIEDILIALELNPASVIVIRNGMVVPEDVLAEGEDELRIIQVSHGG